MGEFGVKLIVDHDNLDARLLIVLNDIETLTEITDLNAALAEANVNAGIDTEKIQETFARLYEFEEEGEEIVIASGRKPVHGKDGSVDFKVDVSGVATYHDTGIDDSKVDFKEAIGILSVKEGDLLAEIIPPTAGQSGLSLSGAEIPARDGKPAVIRVGEGAQLSPDGSKITATTEGRPVFTGGTVLVSLLYEVPGDVDNSTGNVRFKGHVTITGNVLDDFKVEARSIEIMGIVGACEIRSQTVLDIHGGITGRDRAVIHAGTDANIKYVNQVSRITVLGNLAVSREIVNSTVWCRGRVKAAKIIGGDCLGLGGIEASILGSELGVTTVIEPGSNFEVRMIEEKMGELSEKIQKLLHPIQPFFGDRQRYKALPEEKKNAYTQALEVFLSLKENYINLLEKRDETLSSEEFPAVREVLVWKKVFPDVFVRTELCMKQFKTEIIGPVALEEDIDTGTIRPSANAPTPTGIDQMVG